MKFRTLRSLLVLSLALILVIGGTTVAWFTAELKIPSAAEITMGTISFEIMNATVYSLDGGLPGETAETIEWEAGDCKEFSWTLKNTGSKAAFFRARPEAGFTGSGEPEKEATAWGESILTLDAISDATSGEAEVAGAENSFRIAGLLRGETAVAKATDAADAGDAGGDGDAGWISWVLPGEETVETKGNVRAGKSEKAAGVGGAASQKNNLVPVGTDWIKGDDGWFYCARPLESEEKITLVLIGSLSDDALDSQCSVQLQAEAVQATPGAIDAEWPGSPCAR